MSAKTSEAKREAFLRAFAETGNQTLAAEQAGVSRWTVRNLRRADAEFDARWRAAKAASAGRLASGGCNRPPEWRSSGGIDLIVRRAGKRPPQVVRSLRSRWTPRAEDRFLNRLGRCNNARLACAQAGMTLSSYEAHWRRWPDFRRRVKRARALARARIEAMERERLERPAELPWPDEDLPDWPPGMTVADRINLARRAKGEATARRRKAEREAGGGNGGKCFAGR